MFIKLNTRLKYIKQNHTIKFKLLLIYILIKVNKYIFKLRERSKKIYCKAY
jgi:hypothetical protein